MLFIQNMVMIEPGTASLALYLVSKSKPVFHSQKRSVTFLKRNKHEILNAAADELTEPIIDLMQSMVPSWITVSLYILLWIVVLAG